MNINIDLDKLFENLKKISPVVVSIGIVSGLLLFLPDAILQTLHLAELPEIWLRIVAIIFLFCIMICLTVFFRYIGQLIKKKIVWTQASKKHKESFRELDESQKEIIRTILTSKEKQILLAWNDGNADYLLRCGFIFQPAQELEIDWNTNGYLVRFLAQPWLITEFNKNPDFFLKEE